VPTETVRDILAANPTGLSRPALLAWARLRIDPAMTDAALEAEIAALGDAVEDRNGFLVLLDAARSESPDASWSSSERPSEPDEADAPPTVIAGWTPPEGGQAGPVPTDDGSPETVVDWQAPQQSLGKSRVLIAVAALALIGGAIVAQTLLGGETVDAFDLSVGDCIEVPEASEFSELGQTACDEAHTGEVFFVGDHPDGADAAFPSDDAFFEWVGGVCDPAFQTYTGAAYEDQTTLDYGYFTPTADGWEAGDREVICYLALADFSETDQSWKDAFP
jgi:hypothetical protein